jgi:hypothetical protein
VLLCVLKGLKSGLLFLDPHELGRFRRIGRIQELGHDERELFELDWLRHIRVEARFCALGIDIAKDVGGESNNGHAPVPMFLLPSSDIFARCISVLVRHMQIALFCCQH